MSWEKGIGQYYWKRALVSVMGRAMVTAIGKGHWSMLRKMALVIDKRALVSIMGKWHLVSVMRKGHWSVG